MFPKFTSQFLKFLLMLFALVGAGVASVVGSPAPNSKVVQRYGDGFGKKVEDALGITETGVDALPAVEEAVKGLDAKPLVLGQAINTLTDALLKGPRPDLFLEKFLPLMEIGGANADPTVRPAWKWGDYSKRERLQSTMGQTAFGLRATDPKRASEVARATLLLGGLWDFNDYWLGLRSVNDPANDMKTLLGMTDEQFGSFSKLILDRIALKDALMVSRSSIRFLGDRILESKIPVKADELKAILDKLDDVYQKGSIQLGYQYETIQDGWRLLNIVRSKNDAAGIAAVRLLLEKWRRESSDPNIQRWVSQSLERTAPAVQSIRVEMVDVDGHVVELKLGQ